MSGFSPPVVGVVGPTGSGKSALAIDLAQKLGAEIVSCDALQVYRRADVGTGKLLPEERRGVRHHLLDVVDPGEEFSAADYIRLAAPVIKEIGRRGKLPLLVGGTGLYLRALRWGLFDGPSRSPNLRRRIAGLEERRGGSFVHRLLERLDPLSARRIHPNDVVRTIRALEVTLISRRRMSEMMLERRSPLENARLVLVGLSPNRGLLGERIERRVDEMFGRGLVEEVRRITMEYGTDAPALKAIGYRDVARYLRGELTLDEAGRRMAKATRQYAKRQMTWFRREKGVAWFEGCGDDPAVARLVEEHLRAQHVMTNPVGEEALHAKTAS